MSENYGSLPEQEAFALAWPERFRIRHGRRPRILHLCNIANYAWINAGLMQSRGVETVIVDPDNYHINSAPEWHEARIEADHGDDFHPRWHAAKVSGFVRPDNYLNGPTPFVYRELSARNLSSAHARWFYALLSSLYRRGIASCDEKPSWFRKAMESEAGVLRAAKVLMRKMTLGAASPLAATATQAERTASGGRHPGGLPRNVPLSVLQSAFQPFDVVVGYALGSHLPAALDLPRFVSLELGTLRGLPFEDSELGRLCAHVYRVSPEVFITNVDCLSSARRLGLAPERLTPIPHPFDLDAALNYRPSAPRLAASRLPYFFAPARHHWKQGNASWLKGNDVLIRGAGLVAKAGRRFRMIFVNWGEDIVISRALIDEVGLSECVEWINPAPRHKLWPIIDGSVAVVDQFAANAFGGAALETMALGKPVISRLEDLDPSPFFTTNPPVLHAGTPEEVAKEMDAVLDDPDDRRGIGQAGQAWMKQEHGVHRQLGLQFAAFERLVDRHGAARI
jgi:glycosyltransferase involved in cell wall biosynthesis